MSDTYDPLAPMIAALPEKTGRSLDQWLSLVRDKALPGHRDIVNWLKSEHGVTHGYANAIALKARRSDAGSVNSDELLDTMFKGKEQLRTLFDKILAFSKGLGSDVECTPKKGYVSLRRRKQFAIVQPSTKSRIDVGLNLKPIEASGRLEPAGSWNTMVTHRIRLEDDADLDDQVRQSIQTAYEFAG